MEKFKIGQRVRIKPGSSNFFTIEHIEGSTVLLSYPDENDNQVVCGSLDKSFILPIWERQKHDKDN